MDFKAFSSVLFLVALACAAAYAAGPGGNMGGGPGGDSGGGPGGDPGGQGGGGQPGGGGSFTYDSFISVTTNANCLVREGVIFGSTSSLAASVAPTLSSITELADGVFAGNTAITAVDLASTSITEIPSDCFAGCTALASVTLPPTCTKIGANAFAGCTALATLTATGVTTVGDDAFRACTALAVFPSSVKTAGAFSFSETGMTDVDVSGATLGAGAFAGCESLASAKVASGASLPDAVFSGCRALATSDWSGVASFGQASLAGCDALATLSIASSATLGDYAFAAGTATIATTLAGSEVPEYGATSFLGREMSCTVGADVVRIEALPLVAWLKAVASGTAAPAVSVTQPSDYATATLETWLGDASNAGAVMAFCWADKYAADASFTPLTVDGATQSFLYTAQDAGTEDSVAVTVVGTNDLADESGFTADALTCAGASGGVATYVSADTSATECFARLKFAKNW